MSQELVQKFVDILHRTGREDLLDYGDALKKRESDIKAIIDEKSGIERAEELLTEDEKDLEESLRPKLKQWDLQLQQLHHQGKADAVKFRLEDLRIRELKEELRQQSETTRTIFSKESESLSDLTEQIHDNYLESLRTLVNQLGSALKHYRRSKFLTLGAAKVVYLIFILFIFGIGASLIGDTLKTQLIKIGFAIAIWVIQEFFVVPLADKLLTKYRRERLKRLASQLFLRKLWAAYLSANIEYQLKAALEDT